MATYTVDDIRNIVLLGHAGAGKTTLAEAILHKAGITNRLGSVDDKTSILDCDEEEKERGHSVDTGLAHLNFKGKEINVVDTPGYPDFVGASLCSLMAGETAVIVISAADGIQMNTRKMFAAAKERGMACIVVINKIDSNTDNISELLSAIQESFGMECRCANVPSADGSAVFDCINGESGDGLFDVGEAHMEFMETTVEADEELMEAYLGGEEIAADKLATTFSKAMVSQSIIPVVFTSARNEVGIEELLSIVADSCPSPKAGVKLKLITGEGEEQTVEEIDPDPSAPFLGIVFRSISDAKSHIKYSTIRVVRGTCKSDSSLTSSSGKKGMRSGHVNKIQGDHADAIDDGIAGDIITLAKLEDLKILDTVFVGNDPGHVQKPVTPIPMFSLAIEPKSRGDETKISATLAEIVESDPTFVVERNQQTHEQTISGVGEMHVRVNLSRMHRRRGLDVETKPPMIPYRETIVGKASGVEYTHKKQSGGAGQFGRVVIDMEPNETGAGYEFVDKIFGGAIDQPFRPSVDKGCQAAMQEGVIAGYPVVDVKVALVDGKTHPVDSKDIAFQIAGREAFRLAFEKAKPAILEPIVNLEVTIPSDNVGDITGDLASRRGRVQGQDILPGNMAVIKAQVPLAELQQYNSQLKSVTGGQGSYSMELSHYEPVPGNVQQQIIDAAKARKEEKESQH